MKFRKKPVVIEAFQMTAERHEDQSEWPDWLHAAWHLPRTERNALYRLFHGVGEVGTYEIHTLEGAHRVSLNAWIIRGVKGELYPCRGDIFDMTYEAVTDISDALLVAAGPHTPDELEAALSSVTVLDITEAAVENASMRGNGLDTLKQALATAGCTDPEEWMRVFSRMCAPESVHLWAPLLQPLPDDLIS